MYLSKHGLILKNSKIYNKNDSSFDSQVNNGLNYSPDNKLILENTEYFNYVTKIKNSLIKIKKIFEPILHYSKNKQFLLLGPDVLITDNNVVKFIEFNIGPNIIQQPNNIKNKVIKPLMFSIYELLYLEKINDSVIICN